MRLVSHVWVAAFLRVEMADGGFAAVTRRGSPEAGAIFVVHTHFDRSCTVYAPAPQSEFGAGDAAARKFEPALVAVSDSEARAFLDRQIAFDMDCWIVETERRDGDPPLLSARAS